MGGIGIGGVGACVANTGAGGARVGVPPPPPVTMSNMLKTRFVIMYVVFYHV